MNFELTFIFERCPEEEGYMVYVPEIPGAVSQGKTLTEAKENVIDAIQELMAFRRDEVLNSDVVKSTPGTVIHTYRMGQL